MGAVSRRVAPFAPLAIALLAQTALLRTGPSARVADEHPPDEAVVCGEEIPTYEECHSEYPTGCSQAARYEPYLNLLKNQLVRPTKAPLRFFTADDLGTLEQSLLGLPEELTKTNHLELKDDLSKLGEGHVAGTVGYLYYVKKGGKESSNCQLTDADDIDLHLGIGFDPDLAAKLANKEEITSDERIELHQSSVIVEVTPHWRAQFKPAWTVAAFRPAVGRQVRVVGQLLADSEHYVAKDDCGLADAASTCWRATIWELHPVTRFEVCSEGDSCTATSRNWVDLEDFGTAPEPAPVEP